MVSPHPRQTAPLPLPVGSTALRRTLAIMTIVMLVLWAAPALFLPAPWFPLVGIPQPPLAQLVFVRLLGAAYAALCVGYALAWRTPARHPGAILVGIVSNGLGALAILSVGSAGGFDGWSPLGAAYIWGSCLAAAGVAITLLVTGRPLLRKVIADRPQVAAARGASGR